MMQYFEWYLEPGFLWKQLKEQAKKLADEGITAVWIPPAYKGMGGQYDVGYSGYDLYDLGEFDQKGSVATKYGTKDELIQAIRALHEERIHVYADVVLDHKMGADDFEEVTATDYDINDRNRAKGEEIEIGAWTKFTFPGRKDAYSKFKWDWTHFDAVDWDEIHKTEGLFLFKGKSWDAEVDGEKGNYDYLMGADIDLDNKDVVHELKRWGKWFVHLTDVDGFRFDAVKHMRFAFFRYWLKELRREEKEELFSVGEYWNADIKALINYMNATKHEFSLFDVPLHYKFLRAATSDGNYDLRQLFDDTLTKYDPVKSVTFVDNHDTQPGQSLESFIPAWFKPLAYALILLRQDGYPCVFYGDYYGIPHNNIPEGRFWMSPMLYARKNCAYGRQNDYIDNPDYIGWTREGDDEHKNSGLAVVLTDRGEGSKYMHVGKKHANKRFYDCTGSYDHTIKLNGDGCATFPVRGGSVSVWLPVSHRNYFWRMFNTGRRRKRHE